MYNVKVKDYGNGQVQTRIYSHLVYTGEKKKPERILPVYVDNPFEPGTKVMEVNDFNEFEEKRNESMRVSMSRSKQKIYDLSRSNEWDYFVTLTFNPEKVDRYDYECCVRKLSRWLKYMRELCGSAFKYLVVPELHKDGAFHFHGLFANCEGIEIVDSGHLTRSGAVIYNFGKYRLGWSTATRVQSNEAVTKYITKYCTKELIEGTKNKRRYWASKNLNVPGESTVLLEPSDLNILHEELINENIKHFKTTNYYIGVNRRNVLYYENVFWDDEKEGD